MNSDYSLSELLLINKIYFYGNERFKDDELNKLAQELNFNIYNDFTIVDTVDDQMPDTCILS